MHGGVRAAATTVGLGLVIRWSLRALAMAAVASCGGIPTVTEEALRNLADLELTRDGLTGQPKVVFISDENSKFTKAERKTINEVQLYSAAAFDFWLLRQHNFGHGLYAIYVKKDVTPPRAVYLQLFELEKEPVVRGASCFRCHASGPRAMRPLIPESASLPGEPGFPDLRLTKAERQQIVAWHELIAGYGPMDTEFSASEPYEPSAPLTLKACAACHRDLGVRRSLQRFQAFSIHNMVHTRAVDGLFVDSSAPGIPAMPPSVASDAVIACVDDFASDTRGSSSCD